MAGGPRPLGNRWAWGPQECRAEKGAGSEWCWGRGVACGALAGLIPSTSTGGVPFQAVSHTLLTLAWEQV